MLAVMGDAPADLRDAALLSVASEVLARPSDAVRLTVEELTFKADGTGRVLFATSKTDQEGEGAVAAISVECVIRLRRWLAHADLAGGPIFRSIPCIDKPRVRAPLAGRYRWPLSTRDIQRIYKRRAEAAGLDPTHIAGHSPRIGATQDLVAAGISGPLIQQQGRWKSERMVVRGTRSTCAPIAARCRSCWKCGELASQPLKDVGIQLDGDCFAFLSVALAALSSARTFDQSAVGNVAVSVRQPGGTAPLTRLGGFEGQRDAK